jgi:hypothetical protein
MWAHFLYSSRGQSPQSALTPSPSCWEMSLRFPTAWFFGKWEIVKQPVDTKKQISSALWLGHPKVGHFFVVIGPLQQKHVQNRRLFCSQQMR